MFLRNDFGQVPLGTYDLSNSFGYFGMVTVSNYDDNMQPTSDPSVTNWFGHLYASPYNIERLELPIADASQWSMWTPSYYHSEDPYNNTHNTDYWPTSLINFSLGMHLEYNWMHGYHLPTGFGGLNITYATYPLQVINNVPGGVKVRIDFCADNTAVIFNYYADDTRSQYYSFSYSGGRAALTQPSSTNIYTWLTESGRYQEPKAEWGVRDNHSWTNASQKGMLNAALEAFAAQTAAVSFAIGSSVQPWLDTYMGRPGDHVDVTLLNQVSYSVRYVILSFY